MIVEIQGGAYELNRTFELTEEDSGTPDAPIVYYARPSEEVIIRGGVVVSTFEPVSDADILRRLDPDARGHVVQADLRALGIEDFGDPDGGGIELFFDDLPMTLARWPNEGFTHITDLVGGDPVDVRGTKGDQIGKFFYEGDRPTRWAEENDVWVHGYWFWDWSDHRHKVESIDTERRVIAVAPPYHVYGYRTGQWFYAYNVLAELDRPEEWYIDRETGILYFWPPTAPDDAQAVVSVLPTLVTMTDVSHVAVEGLGFEAARSGAIVIAGGSSNRVEACVLRNLGRWAVTVVGGSRHTVAGCEIHDTGEGGISLTGGDRATLEAAKHVADNNHIHHYSRWARMYHPGIALSGVGNRATHNLINDAPHMAVRFDGNDHLIELNEIHSVCAESNDAGAIYCGRDWTMRGTVIQYNYLHDIHDFEGRSSVGVYLDDMLSGIVIFGNVFYRVKLAAFVGGGRDCRIENNIFVECEPSVHVDARALGWAADQVDTVMRERLDAMPYRQPPWSDRYPELLVLWEDDPATPKGNVVARNICIGGTWDDIYDEARPYVSVKDNLIDQDAGFYEQPPKSYRLRDDSPAWALGFEPILFDRIGRYGTHGNGSPS